MNPRRRISAALIGLLMLVGGTWAGQQVLSASHQPPGVVVQADLPVRPLSELPAQVADTWQLVEQGGPFRYRQDDVEFENREGLLPGRPDGYYRKYTVPTPGADDRGARRLITGRDGELYYTADHYSSFVVVDPTR